jgi:predicted kinase
MGHVLALTGLPAAGKSTVAEHLHSEYGFKWIRTRDIVKEMGASNSISSLQNKGLDLSSGSGAEAFCDLLIKYADTSSNVVIDSIRPWSHWQRVRGYFGDIAKLVSVTAKTETRRARLASRDSGMPIEMRDNHAVESEVPHLVQESDYNIHNETDTPTAVLIAMLSIVNSIDPTHLQYLKNIVRSNI